MQSEFDKLNLYKFRLYVCPVFLVCLLILMLNFYLSGGYFYLRGMALLV